MGKIRIQNPDGSEVILKDVRYMPEVRRNLITYGMLEKSGYNYEGRGYMVRFYKGRKKVLAGKYKDGLYYLQGNVSKSEENVLGVVEEVRKKKSKKVTFMENLIQGPTPHGFGTRELLVQGGDSVSEESRSSKETKSEKSCEESKSKDSDFVAYGLAAAEKTDSKESKMNEEAEKIRKRKHWKNAAEEESLSNDVELRDVGKVSKILRECVYGDRVNGDVNLSNIHTSNSFDVLSEAVPGQRFQVGCDLLNV